VKRVVLATAVVLAAVAVWIGVSLPPGRLTPSVPQNDAAVPGVIHVHSNRSDGRSAPEAIAAAAARAGLRFVVFTDHGDGTAEPSPPVYRSGVLCLDGVEISTAGGHYLAIDIPAAPYPLGGEARDVMEDVHRLGGFGVVAHPDSPKDELRWREWTPAFDAIELINLDSGWRARVREPGWGPKFSIVEALATYPFRPAETIADLLGESTVALARWESLTRRRRIVALGGVDAHAKLALRNVDPGDNQFSLPLPGYESSFGTLSVHVRPDRPLSGDAAADATLVVAALRGGHAYVALTGIAAPPSLEFTAANRRGEVQAGDEIAADGPLTLRVRTNAPAGFTTTVWRGPQVFSANHHEQDIAVEAPEAPGVYRVEIRATDRARSPLWILSNPIYVRGSGPATSEPMRPPAKESMALFNGRDASAWKIETNPPSVAALDLVQGIAGGEIRLRFGLATGPPADQFAALAVLTEGGVAAHDRLTFTARAERPMRVSVQLRAAVSPAEDERWHRSVYVDTTDREQTVYFDDVTPIGVTRTYRPPLAAVHSIVLAIDTTNTKPGASGRLWIRNVQLQK
jgi:hypothetical protein